MDSNQDQEVLLYEYINEPQTEPSFEVSTENSTYEYSNQETSDSNNENLPPPSKVAKKTKNTATHRVDLGPVWFQVIILLTILLVEMNFTLPNFRALSFGTKITV